MPLVSFSASSRSITARLSAGMLTIALATGLTFACASAAVARGGGSKAESHAPKSHSAFKGKRSEHITVPSGPLPPTVMAALARAHVPISSMSVVVQRIGAPTPLLAINATEPMLPASTMKLVTTYAGLSLLGPDYRWKTTAYADGQVDTQGVLHGNLYIQGTGDPKLVPEELIDLVDQIRRNGITSIDGGLVLDKRYFDAATRDLPSFDNDDSAPYNVGPDPLLYAFKSLSFTLTPNPDGGVSIDVLPQLAQLQIDNELHVTRGACAGSLPAASPSVSQTASGFVQASFIGDYPLRCGSRTINVAALDHSTFFAGGFLALWKQTGGTFSGTTREGATPSSARLVGTHRSPVLSDVVRDINKFSNNVMARNLFLTIGAATAKPPATPAKSAQAIQQFLHRSALPMNGLSLDNGSGLSRDEKISALSLADLLQAANSSPVAQVFTESLPIAGVDGTMRNRLTNAGALGNAHIKTGTLRDVRAIAGYVGARNGESYVVVSFINDPRAEAARGAHDALLEWVYEGARKAGVAE
ncbi:D-alanyl-D-alanine carboxypeptidase/D-alanyl-D-alanine-endopeptidase [Caballeronia terrestris]|uniref:D-alanyl-D-alanine carboxypeptidase/D-alanyl-D-alanine-endopeptidase n=1 Tax=Caballeronia terrestris TaxID=1226301 RepID=A0A158FDE8_9BURK|nr:D-alanyl-D-alanine carboxypeptidase/D-alanyl-D-alanine-endopeptidase [Caballeronia terrestris]SAL17080.1 D-alanyl-D-alanine carboxypeptidase/D-alanyl-D-alanine-endopeptidase [Caballeronia terrestris]